MEQVNRPFVNGKGYRFEDHGFFWEECPDLVRYEDVIRVTNVEGSGTFHISFRNRKGKKQNACVILDNMAQEQPLRALLTQCVHNAVPTARTQTAWEACRPWFTAALCLDVLVGVIIALNTWGSGVAVSVPIILLPVLLIGRFLSVETLLTIGAVILVICAVGAVRALTKHKPVWEIERRDN